MCDCIRKMNRALAPHAHSVRTGSQLNPATGRSLPLQVLIPLETRAAAGGEDEQSAPVLFASYCPLCGTRYPRPARYYTHPKTEAERETNRDYQRRWREEHRERRRLYQRDWERQNRPSRSGRRERQARAARNLAAAASTVDRGDAGGDERSAAA